MLGRDGEEDIFFLRVTTLSSGWPS